MNKKRLLKLADFLDALPRKNWNFGWWMNSNETKKNPKVGDCGTVGCALGWATTIPSFKRAGLKLIPGVNFNRLQPLFPAYSGLIAVEAASAFFDIPQSDARDIFIEGEQPDRGLGPFVDNISTPKKFAKMLRKYVKDEEKKNAK